MPKRARVNASLRGVERLQADLDNMPAEARRAATEALHAWGERVAEDAKKLVPVLTGRLRSAIEARTDERYLETEVGVWHREAYYSQWVERGNSRQEAQPFLLPAFEANRDEFRKRLREEALRRLS